MDTDPRIGMRAGDFVIVERIPADAVAVYRGAGTRGPAAIKIYDDLERVVPRVAAEALTHRRLRHPALARWLGAGHLADGAYFVASEWIEGASLSTLIASRPGWPEIRRVVGAIGSGLGAIHGAGLVHRDLKPSSVLLPSSGSQAAVLLDFSTSHIAGTVYMSPEQVAGAQLDGRADLYALGVILYQLLTGTVPFEDDEDPANALRRRSRGRDIPNVAEDLCLWLLAKDREARVPNARVLAVALGAISEHGALGGTTISAEQAP